jgi:Zn-dependent peptidase ImmA (M78 family)/transcriptional regulator with XRE-family HTH domain
MSAHIDTLPARLRQAREAAGLTQQQVADWLGIRRPGVVEIESGTRAVKSDELARLAGLYGRSLRWLAAGELGAEDRIQAALFRAGEVQRPELRREAASLARRCHLLFQAEAQLGLQRHHVAVPRYSDENALSEQSQALEHGREVALQERQRLGIGLTTPLGDAWGIVEQAGLHVLAIHLGSQPEAIDGIFTRLESGAACVGVNVDKFVFRQVFTVVHEYGHALLDAELPSELCVTARAWAHNANRLYANRELRANQFAAVFLVPRDALVWFLESRGRLRASRVRGDQGIGITPIDVVRAQHHFGVSAEMVLWRLKNERLIDASQRKALRETLHTMGGVVQIAKALGYQWPTCAQPFTRAHEIALRAYQKGYVSLGGLAEIFARDKADMRDQLREWDIVQEFADTDALIGTPA